MTLSWICFSPGFLTLLPDSVVWSCDFPPKGILLGPRREYSGRYDNRAYGFSVLIPQGFKGNDEDDPLYQRGFGVILGPAPLGYIDVGAEVNSLEETDPRSAIDRMLGYMRKGGKRLSTTRTSGYRLDTLPGQRSVVFYMWQLTGQSSVRVH
jgi:hypothetical protein